jgi:hypothetical protein
MGRRVLLKKAPGVMISQPLKPLDKRGLLMNDRELSNRVAVFSD